MNIKKNDMVKVIAGKDKGKTGKVVQVFKDLNKIVVEKLNKRYKNLRPRKEGEKGQRIEFDAPLDASNVMLVCKKCGQTTKVGYKVSGDKKYRICKKCKETIN